MSPPAAPVVPPREFLVETRTITGFQQRYDVVMSRDKLWFVHPDVKVELEGFWQLPGERCQGFGVAIKCTRLTADLRKQMRPSQAQIYGDQPS
jgi:hypothetical protein